MTYHKELLGRIRNSAQWPSHDKPEFLDELNKIADKAFVQKTHYAYMAAILIYH